MKRHACGLMMVSVLLLTATAWSKPTGDKKDEKKAPQPDYYPLHVGNSWTFKVSNGGNTTKVTTRIETNEEINGKKLALLSSPNVAVTEHLFQDDKGVHRARFNGLEVSPPFKLLPYPPKVGTKWNGEFKVKNDPNVHAYKGEIEVEEAIDVGAGKFKCVKVNIELEENGMTIKTSYWFAPDVGFVKQTFDTPVVSFMLELEKFEKGKK